MKSLILYSSETGNTKNLAESIRGYLPGENDFISVDEEYNFEKYDYIAICYWVNRGTFDNKTLEAVEHLKEKKVIALGTLGAYPDSAHADKCRVNAKEILEKDNDFLGVFLCQGKISGKLIEKFKDLPADHPHAITEEKLKRYEIASKHPNEEDYENARAFLAQSLSN